MKREYPGCVWGANSKSGEHCEKSAQTTYNGYLKAINDDENHPAYESQDQAALWGENGEQADLRRRGRFGLWEKWAGRCTLKRSARDLERHIVGRR
jgi:hypothetical protein